MNGVKIKDIKWVVLEKCSCDKHRYDEMCKRCHYIGGFNKAIDKQGQIAITLNRNNLIRILWDTNDGPNLCMSECRAIADAIISKQHELLEVAK